MVCGRLSAIQLRLKMSALYDNTQTTMTKYRGKRCCAKIFNSKTRTFKTFVSFHKCWQALWQYWKNVRGCVAYRRQCIRQYLIIIACANYLSFVLSAVFSSAFFSKRIFLCFPQAQTLQGRILSKKSIFCFHHTSTQHLKPCTATPKWDRSELPFPSYCDFSFWGFHSVTPPKSNVTY